MFLRFTALLIPVVLLGGCRGHEKAVPSAKDAFILYTSRDSLDPETNVITQVAEPAKTIEIKRSLSLAEKLQILADTLSGLSFHELKIDVMGIDSSGRTHELIANINLRENARYSGPGTLPPGQSWYDYFQGSSGGLSTTITLRHTFLQPAYQGPWIDGLCFFYQGDSIGIWDHIDLGGIIRR